MVAGFLSGGMTVLLASRYVAVVSMLAVLHLLWGGTIFRRQAGHHLHIDAPGSTLSDGEVVRNLVPEEVIKACQC